MQTKDTNVVVPSFARANVMQMRHYEKPAEEDTQSHVGRNDSKVSKYAVDIADEITSLARLLKKGNNEVSFWYLS